MKHLHRLEDFGSELHGGAVSIGNFDGVHRGHAAIIEQLRQQAARVSGPAVVLTFDPHPVRLLRPEVAPPPLTWARRKAELLGELGVDVLIAYPTDRALLELSAEQFFDRILVGHLRARAVVEGPNFQFGKGRQGDADLLARLCQNQGMTLEIVPPWRDGDELVSSSRVRTAIRAGDVAAAARMLTRPYRLRGMVIHGARRGVALGFPTANLDAIDTILPGPGVYAGHAFVRERSHKAAIHVGPLPTFSDLVHKVEVHLLDFSEEIYGEPIEVDFVRRLRDIVPFPSVADLREQLARDVAAARE